LYIKSRPFINIQFSTDWFFSLIGKVITGFSFQSFRPQHQTRFCSYASTYFPSSHKNHLTKLHQILHGCFNANFEPVHPWSQFYHGQFRDPYGLSIYIYKSDCLYLCPRTAGPISTKFCTDLPTNSGKVLNTSMTLPTQPPDPGVPQTPKPQQITGEKTLPYKKCIKFFPLSAGPRLASLYIKQTVYTYVPLSQLNRQTNLRQILYRPPHQLREGS